MSLCTYQIADREETKPSIKAEKVIRETHSGTTNHTTCTSINDTMTRQGKRASFFKAILVGLVLLILIVRCISAACFLVSLMCFPSQYVCCTCSVPRSAVPRACPCSCDVLRGHTSRRHHLTRQTQASKRSQSKHRKRHVFFFIISLSPDDTFKICVI